MGPPTQSLQSSWTTSRCGSSGGSRGAGLGLPPWDRGPYGWSWAVPDPGSLCRWTWYVMGRRKLCLTRTAPTRTRWACRPGPLAAGARWDQCSSRASQEQVSPPHWGGGQPPGVLGGLISPGPHPSGAQEKGHLLSDRQRERPHHGPHRPAHHQEQVRPTQGWWEQSLNPGLAHSHPRFGPQARV